MYKKETLAAIAKKHESVLRDLHKIRLELGHRFVDLDDAILALLLSVAANEPMLLVGPPGTSKSRLIRSFCGLMGLIDENKLGDNDPGYNKIKNPLPGEKLPIGYFEYLLTPFTEPNELFGYYDIGKLMATDAAVRKLERDETGMIHKAYVVYLDEVFNASSAILNSLLAFLQERIFHDRGERKPAYTRAFFAATNLTPESGELKAVYDRFLMRCHVKNVEVKLDGPGHFNDLIQVGFIETYGKKSSIRAETRPNTRDSDLQQIHFADLFLKVQSLQESIRLETEAKRLLLEPGKMEDHPFMKDLRQLISDVRRKGLSEMSNRRVLKMTYVLLIHCLYRSVNEPGADLYELGSAELALVEKFFLDRPKEVTLYRP